MPRAGDTLTNPATGELLTFVRTSADTRGELLEMENTWVRPDHATAPHIHPGMEETWEVLSGRAGFRIGDEETEAGPGDRVVAPPGTVHSAWNLSGGETRLRITMRPALRWEEFVVQLFTDPGPDLLRDFPEEIALPPV
jgi:mannose-6-phosphate isomerase-like protein (cupin superfamily)